MDECPHMLTADTCATCLGADDEGPPEQYGGQIIAARWFGKCTTCGGRIDRGDDIVAALDVGGDLIGWAHAAHATEVTA